MKTFLNMFMSICIIISVLIFALIPLEKSIVGIVFGLLFLLVAVSTMLVQAVLENREEL